MVIALTAPYFLCTHKSTMLAMQSESAVICICALVVALTAVAILNAHAVAYDHVREQAHEMPYTTGGYTSFLLDSIMRIRVTDQPGRVVAVFVFAPALFYKSIMYNDSFIRAFAVTLFVWDTYWLLVWPPKSIARTPACQSDAGDTSIPLEPMRPNRSA